MFSQQLIDWIEEGYSNAMSFLETQAEGAFAERVRQAVKESAQEEQIVMKYYFSAMPYSDLADTDFNLLREYARHTVFLRREIPWCREIPEKTFLMDVAAYRINNEKIMDCRALFFHELWDRVKGLSMKDAVLEANYWCAEHASYHLADSRTASALTVYRSGFGRCGEESVFTVTVLRSIGIPARQVYTPLWAHCDDNHAWVEVWCDGEWYFLGACEPEEVLNKGWFTGPASRAMLLHTKYFTSLPMAEAEFTEGFVRYVNRISMYAPTTELTVRVTDRQGKPAVGAAVHFELLNASFYGGIAVKQTDADGLTSIELGKGSLRIHAVKDGVWAEKTVLSTDGTVTLTLDPEAETEGEWKEYQLHAPDFFVVHPGIVTEEQKIRNKKRMTEADKLRLGRIASYYNEDKARPYPTLQQKLKESAANFDELIRFLQKDDNPYRVKMLETLTIKDMYDLDADVLEEHLQAAMEFEGRYPEKVFVAHLLNPRVEHEELSRYRRFLNAAFTQEQKEAFRARPEAIMEYIQSHISYDESRDFERLRISPRGAMELGMADPVSQRILFCAICRTIGIPARINFMRREAAYYKDGVFIELKQPKEAGYAAASLELELEPDTEWNYFRGWTLCVLEHGMFRPLGLFRTPVKDGRMQLSLPEGVYRLLITVRIPSGDQLVRELTFSLKQGESRSIYMKKHQPRMEELLVDRGISPVTAEAEDGTVCQIEALASRERQMVLWLEPGKEPTQHVLNELLDNEALCRRFGSRIAVLVQEESAKEEPVLAKVRERLPGLSYLKPQDWGLSERIAQELNLPPFQYPLIYVRNSRNRVIYADCGYNVGSVDLMLKLMAERD